MLFSSATTFHVTFMTGALISWKSVPVCLFWALPSQSCPDTALHGTLNWRGSRYTL
ncbi:hypothetical protein ANCCAN_29799 [Ancylostoma caninum]|uniref:Uncharacterized protein n=1 Tax=Ancylostoma caninum TaxID=29170 RepID=A0A368EXL9_ANCCA|nr:hypothetical protein ANCCAN_29799 [Ancylostoma caninum]